VPSVHLLLDGNLAEATRSRKATSSECKGACQINDQYRVMAMVKSRMAFSWGRHPVDEVEDGP
jgi:hypothetical protein